MTRSSPSFILLLLACITASGTVQAAEGASGFYLLGSKGQAAGVVGPPGTYVQSLDYYYSGSTDAVLEIAGLEVTNGVDASVFYELGVGIWIAPKPLFGGNLALTLIVPVGWKEVDAGLAIAQIGGDEILQTGLHDSRVHFGDPIPGASLGWHAGNWHWNLGVMVNVPVGFWEEGNLANIGFNRTAIDTTAAITWLDPQLGLDVSVAAGITYNFENPVTDYKTGTEFHTEWAVIQNFSPTFGFGVTGYHYNQFTGDSGPGARLGDFKGRVTGLGPTLNYTFVAGRLPISTNFKYIFELGVKSRLSGEAALLSVTIPLTAPSG